MNKIEFYNALYNNADFTITEILHGLDYFFDHRSVGWIAANYNMTTYAVEAEIEGIEKCFKNATFEDTAKTQMYISDELEMIEPLKDFPLINVEILSDCIFKDNWDQYDFWETTSNIFYLYVAMRAMNAVLVTPANSKNITSGSEGVPFRVSARESGLGLYPYLSASDRIFFDSVMKVSEKEMANAVADIIFRGIALTAVIDEYGMGEFECRFAVNHTLAMLKTNYHYQFPKATYIYPYQFANMVCEVSREGYTEEIIEYLATDYTGSMSAFCRSHNIKDMQDFKLALTHTLDDVYLLMRRRHELLIYNNSSKDGLGGFIDDYHPFTHSRLSTNLDKKII